MTTRTAYPATESAGDVLTTTNFDKLPGGWIGYAEVTSDQTGVTTIADLTSLAVTVTVNSSRRIRVTGHCALAQNTSTGSIVLYVREGSTTLNSRGQSAAASTFPSGHCLAVLTPTAGSHTYKLSLSTTAGTADLKAAATQPAFILVEDLGPA